MCTLFHLSESQLELIKPFFPRSHGAPRVDDRRVASGIIYVIKHGLQWQDAPDEARTQCCTTALSGGAGSVFSIKFSLSWQIKHLLMLPDDRLIPSQGSPHGGKPAQKGDSPRLIGRTKGDLNSKLHIVCDGHGRPFLLLLTEGQVSDYKGAAILQHLLPDNSTF